MPQTLTRERPATPSMAGMKSILDTSMDTPTRPSTGLGRIFTMTQLMQQEFPPIEYVVSGLIPEGTTILTGAEKIGKSWCVLDIALQCSTGGTALGCIKVTQRPVLYLALEDSGRRLQNRLKQLEYTTPSPDLRFITESENIEEDIRSFLTENTERKPLVILDTLGKYSSTIKERNNAYERDYQIVGNLQKITRDNNGSLLIVHHTNKNGIGDFMDKTSGTRGINGAADTTLNISRERHGDQGTFSMTSRDLPELEAAVTFSGTRWTLQGGSLEAAIQAQREARVSRSLGDLSKKVLDIVNAHPEGVKPHQIAEETELDTNKAGEYLRRLVRQGRIVKQSRGLYKPLKQQ